MKSKKRIKYLQKKKAKNKKKKDVLPVFYTNFDDDGFQFSKYPNEPKLSEMLIALTEPLQEHCPSEDMLYMSGIMAWNISINPSLRKTMPIPVDFTDHDIEMFNMLIDMLIDRKLKLFPSEKRIMVDYFIEEHFNEKTLIVTSTY